MADFKAQRATPGAAPLLRTLLVELLHHRPDFLTDLGFWVHVLNSVHQRGPFGTQLFSQLIRLQRQLLNFLRVSPRVGLLHLVTELAYIAKGMDLGLVAANYFDDVLHVRLSHRSGLSLRAYRHGGGYQSSDNQIQLHEHHEPLCLRRSLRGCPGFAAPPARQWLTLTFLAGKLCQDLLAFV